MPCLTQTAFFHVRAPGVQPLSFFSLLSYRPAGVSTRHNAVSSAYHRYLPQQGLNVQIRECVQLRKFNTRLQTDATRRGLS